VSGCASQVTLPVLRQVSRRYSSRPVEQLRETNIGCHKSSTSKKWSSNINPCMIGSCRSNETSLSPDH